MVSGLSSRAGPSAAPSSAFRLVRCGVRGVTSSTLTHAGGYLYIWGSNDESMYRLHIGPKFGKRKVGSIKPSEVQEFLAELGERYEASTPITALPRSAGHPRSRRCRRGD
ncbi:hypothetical protein [Nonomuraea sp. NPDC050202]|uniref:hypothetical protein n=1 Tax=Nonomuraea sp. NPDC050202 TaxID=3155035 RepID=UPI003405DC06